MERIDPLTYEALFNFLREERRNVQLQRLRDSFYSDVIEYINQKEKTNSQSDQLKNAKKIIEDMYERREKKIITLALNKSRTKSQLIDISTLLPEEQLFFKQIVILLDHFREDILKKVLSKEKPNLEIPLSEPELNTEVKEDTNKETKDEYRIKCVKYVDKFVSSDLEIVGPFDEGEIIILKKELADMLISKNLAEKISPQPL